MRPKLQLLDSDLIRRIVAEARDILATLGAEIHSPGVLALLADHGAQLDQGTHRARIGGDRIDKALATVPHSFSLYDTLGNRTHEFAGDNVYFTPGSCGHQYP